MVQLWWRKHGQWLFVVRQQPATTRIANVNKFTITPSPQSSVAGQQVVDLLNTYEVTVECTSSLLGQQFSCSVTCGRSLRYLSVSQFLFVCFRFHRISVTMLTRLLGHHHVKSSKCSMQQLNSFRKIQFYWNPYTSHFSRLVSNYVGIRLNRFRLQLFWRGFDTVDPTNNWWKEQQWPRCNRVASNLKYCGIPLNVRNSASCLGILCNVREKF